MAVKKPETEAPQSEDTNLRIIALEQATRSSTPGSGLVMSTAKEFLAFLKGQDNADG